MHRQLKRQLKKSLKIRSDQEFDELSTLLVKESQNSELPETIKILCQQFIPLINRIDEIYEHRERELDILNRSLTISSNELTIANKKISEEAASQSRIIKTLRDATNELLSSAGMDSIGDSDTSLEKLIYISTSLEKN